jgi:hypothetical protein
MLICFSGSFSHEASARAINSGDGLAPHQCCGICEGIIDEGIGAQVDRESHVRPSAMGWLKPRTESRQRSLSYSQTHAATCISRLFRRFFITLDEIRSPLDHWHEQHEQATILRVTDAELGAQPCLTWLLASDNTAVAGEQGGVCRIVARETGKGVEHLHDGKRVAHEIEWLGRE